MQELYLNVGARVHFRDGAGGTLHKLVIEPRTKQVTDLVILRGFLQKHDYVIPVAKVLHTTQDDITVSLDLTELEHYPEYNEVEFEAALDDWDSDVTRPSQHHMVWNPLMGVIEWDAKVVPTTRRRVIQGIPEQERVIGRDSVVHNIDGMVGKVDHVWLDPATWEITHLVVHRGLTRRYVVIPYAWVKSVTPQEIYVRGNDAQLRDYAANQLLEATGASSVYATDDAPVATRPIDPRLVVADEIMAALAADSRTSDAINAAKVEVVFDNGVATLLGEMESEEAHNAAEEVAHTHPHVMSVVNALEVRSKPWIEDLEDSVSGLLSQRTI